MRLKFSDFADAANQIIKPTDKKIPFIMSVSGGWERWFQLEYAYALLNHNGVTTVVPEKRLFYDKSYFFKTKKSADLYVAAGRDRFLLELKCQTFNEEEDDLVIRALNTDMKKYNTTYDVSRVVDYFVMVFCKWVYDYKKSMMVETSDWCEERVKKVIIEEFKKHGYNEGKITKALEGGCRVFDFSDNALIVKDAKLDKVCFVMIKYDDVKHGL